MFNTKLKIFRHVVCVSNINLTFYTCKVPMAANVPFIQWVYVTQRSKLSITRSFYYMETTESQKEIVATVTTKGFQR